MIENDLSSTQILHVKVPDTTKPQLTLRPYHLIMVPEDGLEPPVRCL